MWSKYIRHTVNCDKASSDKLSGFSFTFIADRNSNTTGDTITHTIKDAFMSNECDVVGFELQSIDHSNSEDYKDFDIYRLGVDFKWLGGYDADKIIADVTDNMSTNGYKVIGNPEFYSYD